MNSLRHQAFRCVVLLVIALIPLMLAPINAQAETIKIAEKIGNEAWLKSAGAKERTPIKGGELLKENDLIQTGDASIVVLALGDGSNVHVGPFTQYIVLAPEKKENFWVWSFRLVVGTVRSIVSSGPANKDSSRFKIDTETGTAGVRGTDFVITFSEEKKRTDVYTLEGEVYLGKTNAKPQDKDVVIIKANRMSSIDSSGVPQKIKAFIREEFLKKLYDRGFPNPEAAMGNALQQQVVGLPRNLPIAVKPVDPKAVPALAPLNEDNATAVLLEAAAAGDDVRVLQAIEKKADLEARDSAGATPMHLAGKGRRTTTLKLLKDSGADVNALDAEGASPLITIAKQGDLEGIVFMRSANADVTIKDRRGLSAEDYARRRGDNQMATYLSIWRKEVAKQRSKRQR